MYTLKCASSYLVNLCCILTVSFSWIMMIVSPFAIMSNTSWFFIWVMIEISSFSFISIMWTKWMSFNHENRLKYFCVQSISSIMIIVFFFLILLLTNYNWKSFINYLIMVMVVIKLGSVPFHFWLISLSKNINYKNLLVLITWQKIIPIILLLVFICEILVIIMLLNMFISVISQIFSMNMKLLMMFSSVSNISWMMLSSFLNFKAVLLFSVFYFIIMGDIMMKLKNWNFNNMNFFTLNMQMKWMFFSIFSLSGLPPFMGFFPKWVIIKYIKIIDWIMILILFLILTVLNMFIYFRLCWPSMHMKINMFKSNVNFSDNSLFIVINIMILMLFAIM